MEKKLHLYNSKSDYLNEKDSFTPIYNVSYVIDTDEVLYNYVSGQGDTPIVFADNEVKRLCVENWGSGGEITYDQAAAVTDIGTVFRGNVAITSFDELQYFTGLTTIGNNAFNSCTSLTSINIPSGVTTIGIYAFNSCTSLTSINIPSGVTSIGNSAFNSCTSLTNINIPSGVTTIEVGTFYNCISLTSINIPSGVISIGSYAFWGCRSLTSIAIPDSVTSIGIFTFSGCRSLTSITSLAMSAPITQNATFNSLPSDGTLYVQSGATGYDVWLTKLNNWTLSSYTS